MKISNYARLKKQLAMLKKYQPLSNYYKEAQQEA